MIDSIGTRDATIDCADKTKENALVIFLIFFILYQRDDQLCVAKTQ
jgi:hypothetical protein